MNAPQPSYFSLFSRTDLESVGLGSPLARWHLEERGIFVYDEWERQLSLGAEQFTSREEFLFLGQVVDVAKTAGIIISIPLLFKGRLIGIFNLGEKRSGDSYTREDIELLTTLSGQAAIALENARLYEEIMLIKNYNEDLLESLTDGVISVDLEGMVLTLNAKAGELLEVSPEGAVGRPIAPLFADQNKMVAYLLLQTMRTGSPILNFNTSLAHSDRLEIPVAMSTTILNDSSGQKMGAAAVLHDMSEIKALEEKVRQSDKLAAIGTLAAGMAHEIKNPLASMKVLSQLMEKKFEEDAYREKFMRIMPKEIDRIDKIVEGLLGLARSRSPRFQLLKLNHLIEDVLKLIEVQLHEKAIDLKLTLGDIPDVEADVQQVNQVVMNLLLNAIHAMAGGGTLSIETVLEAEARLPLRQRNGTYIGTTKAVVLKVGDTGEGIPEENIRRLFTPFFTTRHAGTGLGLAVTHRIIEEHHGSIDVESKVGEGTCFLVRFPVEQQFE